MPLIATRGAASAQGFGEFAQQARVVQAEAIDFDGTNDFLYRSSLTGAADGKTFTFSAWLWVDTTGSCQILNIQGGSINIYVSENVFFMQLSSTTGGTRSLTIDTFPIQVSLNTWVNVLYSADVSSPSNRYLYINDVFYNASYTDYNNINIDWTVTDVYVGGNTQRWDGRLSNVFLDYTYRNLSIEANRRLFVTADLKPAAGQAALNPILYLPMADPTQPGLNQGTGGNFTLTGTVARSGRGPNQYNAPYSTFDGSADYLESTSAPTGIANGKAFTVHFAFSTTSLSVLQRPITFSTSTAIRFTVSILTTGNLYINGVNASGVTVLEAQTANATFSINRNYVVEISIDLANTSNRHIYVNGVSASTTWFTYSDDLIQFLITTTPRYRIGANAATTPAQYFVGRLGALWFNTSYIDLSQPANLAKFVSGTGIDAAPVDLGATGQLPTGTSPLLYLPLYGNNAARNLGTGGGGFGVISGPYTGARGPNEFWGNWANITTATSGLRTTSGVGTADSGTFSISCSFNIPTSGANTRLFSATNASNAWRLDFYISDTGILTLLGRNAAGTTRLSATSNSGITYNANQFLQLSIDLSSTGTRNVFINGTSVAMTWTTYSNDTLEFSSTFIGVGCFVNSSGVGSGGLTGRLAEFYFTTTYIDFSQEANRLKFRDCFGNPVNLTQQIEALAIPNPAIYMRFPPTAFGTNSGTGGAFTVNGTITDGGQL